MSDEHKTIKFQLMLSPSEAEQIDDWGFKNRIRTRAEAIRRLCQIGMTFDARAQEFGKVSLDATETLQRRLPGLTPRGHRAGEGDLAELSPDDVMDIISTAGKLNSDLLGPLLEVFAVLETLRSDRSQDAIAGAIRKLKAFREEQEADKAERDAAYDAMFGETEDTISGKDILPIMNVRDVDKKKS